MDLNRSINELFDELFAIIHHFEETITRSIEKQTILQYVNEILEVTQHMKRQYEEVTGGSQDGDNDSGTIDEEMEYVPQMPLTVENSCISPRISTLSFEMKNANSQFIKELSSIDEITCFLPHFVEKETVFHYIQQIAQSASNMKILHSIVINCFQEAYGSGNVDEEMEDDPQMPMELDLVENHEHDMFENENSDYSQSSKVNSEEPMEIVEDERLLPTRPNNLNEECTICYDRYLTHYLTGCRHKYCLPCIVMIIKVGNKTCAFCRRVIKGYSPITDEMN